MTDTISVRSAKGKFQGTVEQAAAWLAEMQPAFPSIDTEDGNAEIEVDGTPGASIYRRAIEAALAGVSIAELDAIEAEGEADGGEAAAEAVREQDSLAREEEREADGAAEVAGWSADGWDTPAINAGAHAMAKSMEGHQGNEAARKAYYAAYERGARAAQQALSAEKA